MRRIKEKAYLYPVIVFLLTVGYGLLKIDFGDNEAHISYGWLYFLFGIWVVGLLYLLAYAFVFAWLVGIKKSGGTRGKQFLMTLWFFTLISACLLCLNFFQLSVGVYALASPVGLVFGLSTFGLAVAGNYLTRMEKKGIALNPKLKSKNLMLFALTLTLLPSLLWTGVNEFSKLNQNNDLEEFLIAAYQKKNPDYDIDFVRYSNLATDNLRVEFYLKMGEYTIPAGANLKKTAKGNYQIIEATYLDIPRSYQNLMPIQGNSEEGQQILTEYVALVEHGLKELELDDKLQVKKDGIAYDLPHFSAANFEWYEEFPISLKEQIEKGVQSPDPAQNSFDGWLSLTPEGMMAEGLLISEVEVAFNWEQHPDTEWEDAEELLTKTREDLKKTINFKTLPNGHYILDCGPVEELMVIKEGKFTKEIDIPSRKLVDKLDETNFSISSDYEAWD